METRVAFKSFHPLENSSSTPDPGPRQLWDAHINTCSPDVAAVHIETELANARGGLD